MKLLSSCLGIYLVFLVGCMSPQTGQIPSNQTNLVTSSQVSSQEITLDETLKIAMGQTIYVPVYSEIHHFQNRTFPLAATLSVRNTDPQNPIIITSVKYYNSDGKLVREHLENPLRMAPLATTDFIIDQDDRTGGSGANFIVEWVAETEVYEPIVEAVMVSTTSQQGISFVSVGRVIESKPAAWTPSK
ncbi:MAG: DUF3124 domain-containing protein [Xenococcaceae cyanobacterium MO_167.B27]|nr:DUF3124 domain-containing protein [Xenococcaceae cyanobacterium MO_167.B27]